MPKHKKTKEQKIKADMRRIASSPEPVTHTLSYSFSSATPMSHVQQVRSESLSTVAVVKHDLRKTALISGVILLIQVVLFMLLKNHILALWFVKY